MSDVMDINNTIIPINSNPNEDQTKVTNNKPKKNENVEREVVVINPSVDKMQTSKETLNDTWIDKFFCCFLIFKKYFQITSQDFIQRFINSLLPFNHKFQNLISERPDLYGPIWIYSSVILTISATGSLTRTLQGNNNKNFFQEFVPTAGAFIYGIGFGLPLIIIILMKVFGTSISGISVICTYGYSFSVFLPASIICVIQVDAIQWLTLIYAIFSSTSLLVVSYYKQMGDYSKEKKVIILFIILIFQLIILFLFKLYFFKKFTIEVNAESIEETFNNQTDTFFNDTNINDTYQETVNITKSGNETLI